LTHRFFLSASVRIVLLIPENLTTPRYDEAAAKLAWKRTLEFFNKYLR